MATERSDTNRQKKNKEERKENIQKLGHYRITQDYPKLEGSNNQI
jgi:hypothetical protein